MRVVFAFVVAAYAAMRCAAEENEAFSMLTGERDIEVILNCISTMTAFVPSLTDGDRIDGYSKLEVGNSSLHRNAIVNFHYDGCPVGTFDPRVPDNCGPSTTIFCSVDLKTSNVVRLLAPDGQDPYRRVDHVEFSDGEHVKLIAGLKDRAKNREVGVWAYKTYEYLYDHWAKTGEVRVQGQLISDFIEAGNE